MTIEDDIRFYISEKIATSDCPLETLEEIEKCISELKRMYMWRKEDLKGIR